MLDGAYLGNSSEFSFSMRLIGFLKLHVSCTLKENSESLDGESMEEDEGRRKVRNF